MISLEEALKLAGSKNEFRFTEYAEHDVHHLLKYIIEPNELYHEVNIQGKVVDIYNNQTIYEIQTKHFKNLILKLDLLLDNYPVVVVYPIANATKINYYNLDGELVRKSRSTKKYHNIDVFEEMYHLRNYLNHPNFKFMIINYDGIRTDVMIDKDKTKIKKMRKKYLTINHEIEKINNYLELNNLNDYYQILPEMDEEFTLKEFKEKAKPQVNPNLLILTLCNMGLVERLEEKRGKAYLYKYKK